GTVPGRPGAHSHWKGSPHSHRGGGPTFPENNNIGNPPRTIPDQIEGPHCSRCTGQCSTAVSAIRLPCCPLNWDATNSGPRFPQCKGCPPKWHSLGWEYAWGAF